MMKKLLLLGLLALALLLAGCGPQVIHLCQDGSIAGDQVMTKNNVEFVCPDGTHVRELDRCEFVKPLLIDQEKAGENALAFVEGYVYANGWNPVLVNVNLVEQDWQAQIVVSKYEETSYETTVLVNGESGFATCTKNCHYIS